MQDNKKTKDQTAADTMNNSEGERVAKSGSLKDAEPLREFKAIYEKCLSDMDKCLDVKVKNVVKPVRMLMEDLWAQNQLLIRIYDELQEDAVRQVYQMQRKLEQQASLAGTDNTFNRSTFDKDIELLTQIIEDLSNRRTVDVGNLQFSAADSNRIKSALYRYQSRMHLVEDYSTNETLPSTSRFVKRNDKFHSDYNRHAFSADVEEFDVHNMSYLCKCKKEDKAPSDYERHSLSEDGKEFEAPDISYLCKCIEPRQRLKSNYLPTSTGRTTLINVRKGA